MFYYIFVVVILLLFSTMVCLGKNYPEYLLENPENYNKEHIVDIQVKEDLYVQLIQFIRNYDLNKPMIISLSGGVDSMVLLSLLIKAKTVYPRLFIIAVSINYNQRTESDDEMRFLKEYLRKYNIIHYVSRIDSNTQIKNLTRKQKNSVKRSVFEEESKNIRMNAYKTIIDKFKCEGVFLGHHQDDIIENVFTNTMYGRSIYDLEVLNQFTIKDGIKFYRPLLDFHKDRIYEMAHKYNIPYFLDTTPKWSKRGKMRNEIFPLIDNNFNNWRNNYKKLGKESSMIKEMMTKIYQNKINLLVKSNKTQILIQKTLFEDNNNNLLFWNYLLSDVFHKNGNHMIKRKSIQKICDNFDKSVKLTLDSGWECIISNDKISLYK